MVWAVYIYCSDLTYKDIGNISYPIYNIYIVYL